MEELFWTWLAMAAGFPEDFLTSRGFLGLYSVDGIGAVVAPPLEEGCAGEEDSRRRDGFVRLGVMTVRGPAAGDIEDTEIGNN